MAENIWEIGSRKAWIREIIEKKSSVTTILLSYQDMVEAVWALRYISNQLTVHFCRKNDISFGAVDNRIISGNLDQWFDKSERNEIHEFWSLYDGFLFSLIYIIKIVLDNEMQNQWAVVNIQSNSLGKGVRGLEIEAKVAC